MAIKLVISQPMIFPWRGIFEQMRLSDIFVHYDDVQIPKGGGRSRGFVTRVQVKTSNGIKWLSMPVVRADKGYQLIKDVTFAGQKWRASHISTIENAYRKTPHFSEIYESVVKPVYCFNTDSLSKFCIKSIEVTAKYLGIAPNFLISSELNIDKDIDPSDRILKFCKELEAGTYITGHGALNYLNYDIFEEAGVSVMYMDYNLTPYSQAFGAFTPYVSILDLLFNMGQKSIDYLNSMPVYWKDFVKRK